MNSQNIPINQRQWKMVAYKDMSDVAKKAAEFTQKKRAINSIVNGEFYP